MKHVEFACHSDVRAEPVVRRRDLGADIAVLQVDEGDARQLQQEPEVSKADAAMLTDFLVATFPGEPTEHCILGEGIGIPQVLLPFHAGDEIGVAPCLDLLPVEPQQMAKIANCGLRREGAVDPRLRHFPAHQSDAGKGPREDRLQALVGRQHERLTWIEQRKHRGEVHLIAQPLFRPEEDLALAWPAIPTRQCDMRSLVALLGRFPA